MTSVTIEDTGNLVLRNAANAVVRQSFNRPSDTLLPNKIFAANNSRAVLTAWENDDDWRDGNYSLRWSSSGNLSSGNISSDNLTAVWQIPYPWYG